MKPIFIILACALLLAGCILPQKPIPTTGASENNWTDDGHGGVYWTMNNYTISAYPKTSSMTGNSFYQLVNFTSANPNPIMANLSFVFNEAPSSGAISIWRNTTTRQNATYTIIGVTNFTISTANCSIGDNLNIYKYNVTYNTSMNGIACFDSYAQSGNNYTITYSYNRNYVGWENILSQFHYTQVANHHVWTIENVPFNGSTNYQTRFEYSFPLVVSVVNEKTTSKPYNGKFDIYAHTGSPSDVVNGIGTILVVLDPYYNSTGGTVTYDGLYTVVTFLSNGTFNVTGTINATVLVVAGGGGAGGGGGGAGGLLYNTSYSATGNITVVVGAGGAGIPYQWISPYPIAGVNGSVSSFGTMTTVGGGGGANQGVSTAIGQNGGSGGGGGAASGSHIGGVGTASQGTNGGDGYWGTHYGGGGGGGANTSGINATTTNAGNGGAGLYYTINGSSVCYAGGGGGGNYYYTAADEIAGLGTCGGANGGGNNTNSLHGFNATANTGGGGGGATNTKNGGNGGSGIVIIRYLTYVAPPPMNASLYATTATNAYNGTHITYLFVLLAIANGTVTNANMSLTANGTLLNSSIQNMTANQTFTMTASWMAARPTTDGNFTLTAKASDGTSEATTSYLLILPIDPPSAIALKGGSKSVNLTTTTGQPERFYLGDLPVSCKAPVNQTGSVGIYNVTNNGTATVNVVFSTNATFFGFDYTISNASTCASGKNMTTSNQTLYSGLAVNASQLFWAWANANTSLSIPPKFKISAGGT